MKKTAALLLFFTLLLLISSDAEAKKWWEFWKKPVKTAVKAEPAVTVPADKIAGWTIYKSDECGFEFKYPAGLVVKPCVYESITAIAYGQKRAEELQKRLCIRILLPFDEKQATNLSVKAFEVVVIEKPPAIWPPEIHPNEVLKERREMTVNGNNFYIIETGEGAMCKNFTERGFVSVKNGKYYGFNFLLQAMNRNCIDEDKRPPEYDRELESRIFGEILSTVRFYN